MSKITKFFKSLVDAEKYQQKLYSKYTSVILVNWPRFEESGDYSWRVRE